MRGFPLARRLLTALAVAALLAGCGSATKNSGPAGSTAAVSGDAGGVSSPPSGDDASEVSSPAPEGTGPESPQPKQDGGPSISVASLPVGGAGTADPANPDQQCGSVNWLLGPLPSGVVVQLGDISFDPPGIFERGGDGCGSDQPVCNSGTTWTEGSSSCSVPVIQLDPSSAADVTIVVAGKINCPSQAVCDQLRGQLNGQSGSQAIVTAIPHDTQTSDASTSSPSDQASSSPAGS